MACKQSVVASDATNCRQKAGNLTDLGVTAAQVAGGVAFETVNLD